MVVSPSVVVLFKSREWWNSNLKRKEHGRRKTVNFSLTLGPLTGDRERVRTNLDSNLQTHHFESSLEVSIPFNSSNLSSSQASVILPSNSQAPSFSLHPFSFLSSEPFFKISGLYYDFSSLLTLHPKKKNWLRKLSSPKHAALPLSTHHTLSPFFSSYCFFFSYSTFFSTRTTNTNSQTAIIASFSSFLCIGETFPFFCALLLLLSRATSVGTQRVRFLLPF